MQCSLPEAPAGQLALPGSGLRLPGQFPDAVLITCARLAVDPAQSPGSLPGQRHIHVADADLCPSGTQRFGDGKADTARRP